MKSSMKEKDQSARNPDCSTLHVFVEEEII